MWIHHVCLFNIYPRQQPQKEMNLHGPLSANVIKPRERNLQGVFCKQIKHRRSFDKNKTSNIKTAETNPWLSSLTLPSFLPSYGISPYLTTQSGMSSLNTSRAPKLLWLLRWPEWRNPLPGDTFRNGWACNLPFTTRSFNSGEDAK